MAQGSALDPNWVPAPLEYSDSFSGAISAAPSTAPSTPVRSHKIAVFKRHSAYDVDKTVIDAIDQAATWLAAAGYELEEVEPPHFEEGAALWRDLVYDDLRRAGKGAVAKIGDAAVRANLEFMYQGRTEYDRDSYLEALARRLTICRAWSEFFVQYPVLLMPNSWQRQFAIDDDTRTAQRMNELVAAQSPLLGTAMMGLPGLSVPTGLVQGLPTGVQLVSEKFREDLILRAGGIIERAAGFCAIDHLI